MAHGASEVCAEVACVIPVRNGARYVLEAIDSVRSQTLRPAEIVIVDDGSTDETPALLAGLGDVRVVTQTPKGPAAARNAGIRATDRPLVTFLDSDDLWTADKTRRQIDALGEGRVTVCGLQNFWMPEVSEERDRLAESSLAKPMIAYLTQCLMVRREVFEEVGYFDETAIAGDCIDWFLRVRDAGIECRELPDVLVRRRLHLENRSRALAVESQRAALRAIHRSRERVRSHD